MLRNQQPVFQSLEHDIHILSHESRSDNNDDGGC